VIARLTSGPVQVAGTGSLKRAPKGYPADHPTADLLRHKGLIAWRDWPVEPWLGTPAAKDRVVDFLRTAAPFQTWLDTHVGPATGG
jgi:uncharacterized protein (DUF2461 family)